VVWIVLGGVLIFAAFAGTMIQAYRLSKLKIGKMNTTWLDMWRRR
jgi:hypothetical protein